MNIRFNIICVENAKEIEENYRPIKDFEYLEVNDFESKVAHFKNFLEKLTRKDFDELFMEIFSEVKDFEVNLTLTSGIPYPYDAWCYSGDEVNMIFFNLSLWDAEKINKHAESILIHEITHFLLKKFYENPYDLENKNDILDYVAYDEGLAHFLGFPGNREDILSIYLDKREKAKKEFLYYKNYIRNNELSKEELIIIYNKATSGNYWEKFASIYGMFIYAEVFEKHGAKGIKDVIKNGISYF